MEIEIEEDLSGVEFTAAVAVVGGELVTYQILRSMKKQNTTREKVQGCCRLCSNRKLVKR